MSVYRKEEAFRPSPCLAESRKPTEQLKIERAVKQVFSSLQEAESWVKKQEELYLDSWEDGLAVLPLSERVVKLDVSHCDKEFPSELLSVLPKTIKVFIANYPQVRANPQFFLPPGIEFQVQYDGRRDV